MAKRPGLPAKYAKHGFKEGWRLYEKAKRARMYGKKKAAKAKKVITIKSKGSTMAKQKKPVTKVYVMGKGKPKTTGKRRSPRLVSQQTLNMFVDGGIMATSAVLSTVLINIAPLIKDQRSWIKALGQGVAGVVAMNLSKDKYLKRASMGVIIGSALSLGYPLLPANMKVFGGRRRFSPTELSKIQTLGRPYSLGKPVQVGMPVKIPVASTAMGKTATRQGRFS